VGASTGADAEGRALYRAAKVGAWQVALGDVVQLPAPEESDSDSEDEAPAKKDAEGDVEMGEGAKGAPAAPPARKIKMPPVGLVQCLVQDKSGEKVVQVGLLCKPGRVEARQTRGRKGMVCSQPWSLDRRMPSDSRQPLCEPPTWHLPLTTLPLDPRCACCCLARRLCWATPVPTPSSSSPMTTPLCPWPACLVGVVGMLGLSSTLVRGHCLKFMPVAYG
jgi:hypothetical protein